MANLRPPPLHVVEFSGPASNDYDRTYVIDPHEDCTRACGDALTVRFHKGSWFVSGACVEIDDELATENLPTDSWAPQHEL